MCAIQISQLPAGIAERVHLVQFILQKPAHLPFNLLAYTQQFMYNHNCRIYNHPADYAKSRFTDVFDICPPSDSNKKSIYDSNKKIKMVFSKHGNISYYSEAAAYRHRVSRPYKYAYYTEADQIVSFQDMDAVYGISTATNLTQFLLPRRKEKMVPSVSHKYRGHLSEGRYCGSDKAGCAFEYPALGRKQLVFRSQEKTHRDLAPDVNYIYCNPVPENTTKA